MSELQVWFGLNCRLAPIVALTLSHKPGDRSGRSCVQSLYIMAKFAHILVNDKHFSVIFRQLLTEECYQNFITSTPQNLDCCFFTPCFDII